MEKGVVARASATVDAPIAKVWEALVNPELIKQYMFGAEVVSDWKQGSSIVWKGEWKGQRYESKGTILQVESGRRLQYNHFSPHSGLPDSLDNYNTVTFELSPEASGTRVSLWQDNNPTVKARENSEKDWSMMLARLKTLLEK